MEVSLIGPHVFFVQGSPTPLNARRLYFDLLLLLVIAFGVVPPGWSRVVKGSWGWRSV